MIGRSFRQEQADSTVEPKGFDDFEFRLGDMMRGERATLGKSLLDVQRELKIKAAYIAAIENADPTAFDTPGFIAGYVRSYARYLNLDPDWAFDTFCHESGFATSHGMSADASQVKPTRAARMAAQGGLGRDIFSGSATPFIPAGEGLFTGVEPRAIGSIVVLVALIGGLGYGGWAVLQEVQRVQFAPVEQAPTVIAEVDPLAGATRGQAAPGEGDSLAAVTLPSPEALDRLYRPQALDVPVLVARDGPISTLDPGEMGALAGLDPEILEAPVRIARAEVEDDPDADLAEAVGATVASVLGGAAGGPAGEGTAVQVTEPPRPGVTLVAVREAWVRVRAADGSVIYEGTMFSGDTYDLPQTEEPPTLRVGESGALYFAMNGAHYGPAGGRGAITSDLPLSSESLLERYEVADLDADADLAEFVRVAEAQVGGN